MNPVLFKECTAVDLQQGLAHLGVSDRLARRLLSAVMRQVFFQLGLQPTQHQFGMARRPLLRTSTNPAQDLLTVILRVREAGKLPRMHNRKRTQAVALL